MNLREMIETGSKVAGNQKTLAGLIGISDKFITEAKAGRRGLPAFSCVKLAQLIGEDERRVIAASELVTEKNPERRAVWLPFVQAIAKSARKQTARTAKDCSEAVIFHL